MTDLLTGLGGSAFISSSSRASSISPEPTSSLRMGEPCSSGLAYLERGIHPLCFALLVQVEREEEEEKVWT